ncbi:MAG: TetR/AcrR family transcriptional regulator [Polyangiales bacterium]
MSSPRVKRVRVEPRSVPEERPGPEGGPRDRRRRARTEAIATAALRLFLEQGVEAVAVEDIAARARVSKASFYTYFKDKADVVDALLEPVSARLRDAFARCEAALRAAEEPGALVAAYAALAADCGAALMDHPSVARLYLQESRAPGVGARRPIAALARSLRDGALALTLAGRAHGLLRPVDPEVSAAAVLGAVEAILFRTLSEGAIGSPEAVTGALIELVLHGVAARGGDRTAGP